MAYKDKKQMIEYNRKYNEDNYDRYSLMLPKGKKQVIKDKATANGESVNAFINRAIDLLLNENS